MSKIEHGKWDGASFTKLLYVKLETYVKSGEQISLSRKGGVKKWVDEGRLHSFYRSSDK